MRARLAGTNNAVGDVANVNRIGTRVPADRNDTHLEGRIVLTNSIYRVRRRDINYRRLDLIVNGVGLRLLSVMKNIILKTSRRLVRVMYVARIPGLLRNLIIVTRRATNINATLILIRRAINRHLKIIQITLRLVLTFVTNHKNSTHRRIIDKGIYREDRLSHVSNKGTVNTRLESTRLIVPTPIFNITTPNDNNNATKTNRVRTRTSVLTSNNLIRLMSTNRKHVNHKTNGITLRMIGNSLLINVIMRNNFIINSVRVHRGGANTNTMVNGRAIGNEALNRRKLHFLTIQDLNVTASGGANGHHLTARIRTLLNVTRLNDNNHLLRIRRGTTNVRIHFSVIAINDPAIMIHHAANSNVLRRVRVLISTLVRTIGRRVSHTTGAKTKTRAIHLVRRVNIHERHYNVKNAIRYRRIHANSVKANDTANHTMRARLARARVAPRKVTVGITKRLRTRVLTLRNKTKLERGIILLHRTNSLSHRVINLGRHILVLTSMGLGVLGMLLIATLETCRRLIRIMCHTRVPMVLLNVQYETRPTTRVLENDPLHMNDGNAIHGWFFAKNKRNDPDLDTGKNLTLRRINLNKGRHSENSSERASERLTMRARLKSTRLTTMDATLRVSACVTTNLRHVRLGRNNRTRLYLVVHIIVKRRRITNKKRHNVIRVTRMRIRLMRNIINATNRHAKRSTHVRLTLYNNLIDATTVRPAIIDNSNDVTTGNVSEIRLDKGHRRGILSNSPFHPRIMRRLNVLQHANVTNGANINRVHRSMPLVTNGVPNLAWVNTLRAMNLVVNHRPVNKRRGVLMFYTVPLRVNHLHGLVLDKLISALRGPVNDLLPFSIARGGVKHLHEVSRRQHSPNSRVIAQRLNRVNRDNTRVLIDASNRTWRTAGQRRTSRRHRHRHSDWRFTFRSRGSSLSVSGFPEAILEKRRGGTGAAHSGRRANLLARSFRFVVPV